MILFLKKQKLKKEKPNVLQEEIKLSKWKAADTEYLNQLQRMLDRMDNISDPELKKSIIYETLRCDALLTKLSEDLFEDYYLKGYQEAKKA